MRSVHWQLVEYALGPDITHGDRQCCNKIKPHSILWATVSNFTSWIFHCIQVTLLVNVHHYTFCHKHTVVPSVASGKSVKSRPPLICCSVAESCSLNVSLRILRLCMASFANFHNCVSCILWTSASAHCGLHSSGVNSEVSLVYFLKSNDQ
jgi:hypothetical protein